MAMNDIKTNVDLIGLSIDDLTFDIENEGNTYTLTGGQRAWVRRCIDKANKEFVGKVAERGEVEPVRGETSAIKALVETIKNEEVSIITLHCLTFIIGKVFICFRSGCTSLYMKRCPRSPLKAGFLYFKITCIWLAVL